MSKGKKQNLSLGGGHVPSKSEYDDEEAAIIKGEKIKVKSGAASGGGVADAGGSKAYNFTGIKPGRESVSASCEVAERPILQVA